MANSHVISCIIKNAFLVLAFTFVLNFHLRAQELTLDESFTAGVGLAPASNKVSAVQPDGKILVGGNFRFANGTQVRGVVRLNPDGALDTSFNTGGSGSSGTVFEIVVQDDGKILIGGGFSSYNGIAVKGLARLNSDGSLDTTFNVGGSGVFSPGSGGFYQVRSIVVLADGKILAAGQSIQGYNGVENKGIFRTNPDGSLDTSFVSGFTNLSSIEEIAPANRRKNRNRDGLD